MFRYSAAALLILANVAQATADPVLVEVFASQNCPACPQAHKVMDGVSKQDDVLVLTWSVDYWDYLGDADPLAIKESGDRQAAYAERLHLRAPYTPQAIYNGAKQCAANKQTDVMSMVESVVAATGGELQVELDDGALNVSGPVRDDPVDVVLIHYKQTTYADFGVVNAVLGSEKIGQWSGGDTLYDVSCDNSCVAIVQAPEMGPILGWAGQSTLLD